jgi:hypothetical protein
MNTIVNIIKGIAKDIFNQDTKEESFKESYTVVAYDKDNDVYNDLDKFDDLDRAIEDAKFYYERLTNPKFLEGEEPIDWIEVEDANGKVVWASYDNNNNIKEDFSDEIKNKWVNFVKFDSRR